MGVIVGGVTGGKSDADRRFEVEQVSKGIPSVVGVVVDVSVVEQKIRSNFSEPASKGRAARASIQPEDDWGRQVIGESGGKYVMN